MSPGSDDFSDPEKEAEKRREAAADFIEGKGGIELLCEFPRYGELRFEEVVEIAPVSRATVSARLKEAQEAGLMEVTYISSATVQTKSTNSPRQESISNRKPMTAGSSGSITKSRPWRKS